MSHRPLKESWNHLFTLQLGLLATTALSNAKSTNASAAAATKGGADYSELRRHVVSATLANHDIADKEEGERVGAEQRERGEAERV